MSDTNTQTDGASQTANEQLINITDNTSSSSTQIISPQDELPTYDELLQYTATLQQQLQQAVVSASSSSKQRNLLHTIMQYKLRELETIGILSGVLMGFSLTFIAQTQIPDVSIVNDSIQTLFSIFGILTVSMNGIVLVLISLQYLAVLQHQNIYIININKYSTTQQQIHALQQYNVFWSTRCSRDYKLCLTLFLWSLPVFTIDVSIIGFIQFYRVLPAKIICCAIACCTALYIVLWIFNKYSTQTFYHLYSMQKYTSDDIKNIEHTENHIDTNDIIHTNTTNTI